MPETEQGQNREEDLRQLLTEAIEVQLAALRAGIGFWSEWIEETSEFVNSATQTLASITSEEQQAKDMLLELVDAGRASVRSMTEIPRHTATRFIEELDRLEQERDAESTTRRATKRAAKGTTRSADRATKQAAKGGTSAAKNSTRTRAATKTARKSRRKRAGRVKS